MEKIKLISFNKMKREFIIRDIEVIGATELTLIVDDLQYRAVKKEDINKIVENLFEYKSFITDTSDIDFVHKTKKAMIELSLQQVNMSKEALEKLL